MAAGDDFEPIDLGPYRLVAELGAGGFATVFRTVSTGELGFEREVAVKLLHEHLIRGRKDIIMGLSDEARLLGRIRHPNVVAAQWFGQLEHPQQGPVWAIVMDFVRGRALHQLVARRRGLVAGSGDRQRGGPERVGDLARCAAFGPGFGRDRGGPGGHPADRLPHRRTRSGGVERRPPHGLHHDGGPGPRAAGRRVPADGRRLPLRRHPAGC
ncbi:MAG: protein kinase [Proteobacteria bacterium]|nr:protein kinase [Pseudomonadota bacterium]